jgi:thioredoxin-like negative regulator of GroEL
LRHCAFGRQERLAQLKAKSSQAKTHREAGHGELREIVEEEFLKDVTSTKHVVVHFFHEEFQSCKVMDKHLRKLAARALQTKFLRINGESSRASLLLLYSAVS